MYIEQDVRGRSTYILYNMNTGKSIKIVISNQTSRRRPMFDEIITEKTRTNDSAQTNIGICEGFFNAYPIGRYMGYICMSYNNFYDCNNISFYR